MKGRTKVILGGVVLLALVGAGGALRAAGSGDGDDTRPSVDVTRGTVVDKALAVGQIEPEIEISVKSQTSGVVQRTFAEEGDFVRAGRPLIEIRPNPTPLELAEARRQVQLRALDLENSRRELERQRTLMGQGLTSEREFQNAQQQHAQLEVQHQMALERLSLLAEGKLAPGDGGVQTVVRSPIDGFILEALVEIGDPVVPLSTYQEGTPLLRMAEMSRLVFRGTVDEIDVGRLREGMPVALQIGALPDASVTGRVARISLKARTEDNATVFPVEILLDDAADIVLRAGYSANASIIIARRDSVVVIPERVVTFAGDSTTVTVLRPDGTEEVRRVTLGLSDAITVEVREGLAAGEQVLEKPVKEIR